MRKILILVAAILSSCVQSAFCEFSQSSGEKTSDTAVYTSTCYLSGVEVITDGTNDAKLIIYDNSSGASGKKLLEMTVPGSNNYGVRDWSHPVEAVNGLYGDVTGTGASFFIEYIKEPTRYIVSSGDFYTLSGGGYYNVSQ